jgi:predicted GNAT family acetyltransferase
MNRIAEKTLNWFKRKSHIDSAWINKARLVELKTIDVSEDPVRPEIDLKWRRSFDRKIFGLKHGKEIRAVVCLAFTNDVPHTVRELDLMSKISKYEKNADIAIAYTVWSRKKGGGKKIMQEVLQYARKKKFKKVVTLSPLTPMATHYHIRNGAKLVGLNAETQNFEYSL